MFNKPIKHKHNTFQLAQESKKELGTNGIGESQNEYRRVASSVTADNARMRTELRRR